MDSKKSHKAKEDARRAAASQGRLRKPADGVKSPPTPTPELSSPAGNLNSMEPPNEAISGNKGEGLIGAGSSELEASKKIANVSVSGQLKGSAPAAVTEAARSAGHGHWRAHGELEPASGKGELGWAESVEQAKRRLGGPARAAGATRADEGRVNALALQTSEHERRHGETRKYRSSAMQAPSGRRILAKAAAAPLASASPTAGAAHKPAGSADSSKNKARESCTGKNYSSSASSSSSSSSSSVLSSSSSAAAAKATAIERARAKAAVIAAALPAPTTALSPTTDNATRKLRPPPTPTLSDRDNESQSNNQQRRQHPAKNYHLDSSPKAAQAKGDKSVLFNNYHCNDTDRKQNQSSSQLESSSGVDKQSKHTQSQIKASESLLKENPSSTLTSPSSSSSTLSSRSISQSQPTIFAPRLLKQFTLNSTLTTTAFKRHLSKPLATKINMGVDQAVIDKLEAGFAKLQAAGPDKCHSLLKKYLTRDVLDKLKDHKTAMGATLLDVAQSGFENLDSGVGIYAPDAESYTLFSALFDPIIEDYHGGFKATDKHPASDFGDLETLVNVDPTNEYVISTRVRCGRSLKGYPFNPCLTEAQYKEMESKVSSTFKEMEGDLAGTYYPLTGMTKETQQQLIDDHFLFKEGDRFLQAANACRYWPTGRGIYHNAAKTFLVWVNEEDHLRIISMQKGGDLKEVFGRLVKGARSIEAKVPFSRDDRLGFLTFCPTNLGTTIRASVHIKLPKLAADRKKLEEVAGRYNLQVRGTSGEHTESIGGIYDISNKRRLGLTEYQAVREMQDGILELIKIEKSL